MISYSCLSSQNIEDISFNEGDVIEIINPTNKAHWWLGRAHGRQGLFPPHYVKKMEGFSVSDERPLGVGKVNGEKGRIDASVKSARQLHACFLRRMEDAIIL